MSLFLGYTHVTNLSASLYCRFEIRRNNILNIFSFEKIDIMMAQKDKCRTINIMRKTYGFFDFMPPIQQQMNLHTVQTHTDTYTHTHTHTLTIIANTSAQHTCSKCKHTCSPCKHINERKKMPATCH